MAWELTSPMDPTVSSRSLHANALAAPKSHDTRPTNQLQRSMLLLIADSDSQLLACEALCSAPTDAERAMEHQCDSKGWNPPSALLQRLAQRASLRHQGLTQLLRDRRLKGL